MHDMIKKIIEKKKEDISSSGAKPSALRYLAKRGDLSSNEIASSFTTPRNDGRFINAIEKSKQQPAIIAELKFASPASNAAAPELATKFLGSSGTLIERAKAYEQAGAAAISIITEKHFFKGDSAFVTQVKKAVNVPILQKDFIIDEKQIYQAKQLGSDALLLIARIVDAETLQRFVNVCLEIGIEPVVEIVNQEDLHKAVTTRTRMIAVNARDLDTFTIDVLSACQLIKEIPEKFVKLAFSGVQGREEFVQYTNVGAQAILIGTRLMKESYVATFFKTLRYE